MALIFALSAAIVGYALVHGVTKEAVLSETWRQSLSVIGGGFVAAVMRLAAPVESQSARL